MLASGRNGLLSVLGGPETSQLTLGAGRRFGRTAEDGQAAQGNAVQPAGDLVVHKQVQGPKAPSLQPGGGHLFDFDETAIHAQGELRELRNISHKKKIAVAEDSPPGRQSALQERRHTTLWPPNAEAASGTFPKGEQEWPCD